MVQLHKQFTDDQVKMLLHGYCQGLLSRDEIQEMLSIGKTRFFAILKEYRQDPEAFSITYKRRTPGRLPADVEAEIERELLREKEIVENKDLPISGYNYSALRDRLKKNGIKVSVPTIIDRAKRLECYIPRKKKRKSHDRQVLTASPGALVQHDSSLHLWSPFAADKWTLITSIDDFSRKLLFADFFLKETTWAHIQATQAVMQAYGIPLRYYVDSLRVFRFVQGRDSVCLGKHLLNGRCPVGLAGRSAPLQLSSSPLHHWRNPQHPLRKSQETGQQSVSSFLFAKTLHVAQRRFLST
jgi:hypothetical protein